MKKEANMKGDQVKAFVVPLLFFISIIFIPHGTWAAEKVITLRYAHYLAVTTVQVKLAQEWCKEVESRTNGRVKVALYPGATLMPVAQAYDGVTKEVADISRGVFSYSRGRFPLTEVIDLPLGYKSGYAATKLINEYYKKFNPKELDDVKVLYLEGHGPGLFHTRKPISRLEDLRGMKIRASGLSAKIVTALGGTPVSLPLPDAYDALARGVADGITNDIGGVWMWKTGEVVKYHIESYSTAYTSGIFTVMNKNKWNSLPEDVKKIIDEINEEYLEKSARMWTDFDATGKIGLLKMGNKFVALSDQENARWAEKMRPIFDDYVKSTKEKGLPGGQALQFCVDYLKTHNK